MVWDVDSKALQNTEGKQQKQKKSWQMSSTSVAVKVGYFEGCADFHIYIYIYVHIYSQKSIRNEKQRFQKQTTKTQIYYRIVYLYVDIRNVSD